MIEKALRSASCPTATCQVYERMKTSKAKTFAEHLHGRVPPCDALMVRFKPTTAQVTQVFIPRLPPGMRLQATDRVAWNDRYILNSCVSLLPVPRLGIVRPGNQMLWSEQRRSM